MKSILQLCNISKLLKLLSPSFNLISEDRIDVQLFIEIVDSIDTSYSAVERTEYDVFESKQTKNRKKKFILALITNVLEIDVVLFYYAAIEWWYGARESSLQRIDKEAASVRGYNRLRWERFFGGTSNGSYGSWKDSMQSGRANKNQDDKENLRAINSDSEKEVLRINIEEEEEEDEDEEGDTGDEVVEENDIQSRNDYENGSFNHGLKIELRIIEFELRQV
ncbi:hypothetical protein V1477_001428 [Vespula maculifrons]|uniref:Uncharacterized protein n=1 Tax=Vespula maculifrons TaxID=7453 RepID=A0ABD2D0D5_VESMC